MVKIYDFEDYKNNISLERKTKAPTNQTGKIILFTGVRYERISITANGSDNHVRHFNASRKNHMCGTDMGLNFKTL